MVILTCKSKILSNIQSIINAYETLIMQEVNLILEVNVKEDFLDNFIQSYLVTILKESLKILSGNLDKKIWIFTSYRILFKNLRSIKILFW